MSAVMTANSASAKPAITDTGIKGFLKWFKREQPELYRRAAPAIMRQVPSAFSNYDSGGGHLTAGMSSSQKRSFYARPYSTRARSNISDYEASSYEASPSFAFNDFGSPSYSSIDMSSAANSGSIGSTIAGSIGSIIGGLAAVAMPVNSVIQQNKLLDVQLQRAAAGLPPLNTSLNSMGIPTVTGIGMGSDGLLLLLVIGGAALMLTGRGGGGGRRSGGDRRR